MRRATVSLCTVLAAVCAACGPPASSTTAEPLEATWDRTLPAPGSSSGRWASPLVPLQRVLFTFGGSNVVNGWPTAGSYALQLDDSSWHIRDDRGRPSARAHHCAAPIPPLDQVLVVGGANATGPMEPRAWTLEATLEGWSAVDGTTGAPLPDGTAGCHAAWLPGPQVVVVFGGESATGLSDETHLYDPRSRTFRRLALAERPPARRDGAVGIDEATGRIFLFGGFGAAGELDDLWAFDGERWHLLEEHAAPGPRRGAAAAFADGIGRLLVVGGLGPSGTLDDVWAYAPDTATWQPISPAPDPSRGVPVARAFSSAAWERDGARLLLFGGIDGAMGTGEPLADGWALHPRTARNALR
jgi:hypothetical protein